MISCDFFTSVNKYIEVISKFNLVYLSDFDLIVLIILKPFGDMDIFFIGRFYNCSASYLQERFFSLSFQQQKTRTLILVAAAALSCLALSFLLYRWLTNGKVIQLDLREKKVNSVKQRDLEKKSTLEKAMVNFNAV